MKLLALFAFIAIMGLAQAFNASDYLQLYNASCDSDFGSAINCSAIFNVSNPSAAPVTMNRSNFAWFWRTVARNALNDSWDSIRNLNLQRWNGANWVNLNLAGGVTLPARSSHLVKIAFQKAWVPSNVEGEYILENIDFVPSAFGFNYSQFVWLNNSYTYKKNFTVFLPQAFPSNSTFMFVANLSVEVAAGKLDKNGSCFRIVDQNETGELTFEHEQSNLTFTNYTAFVFNNFTSSGNYTFWGYYGDLGSCTESNGNINNAWNYTGAMIVSHFGFDRINGSSFHDSAGEDQNFTIVGSLPLVATNFGLGFQKNGGITDYALSSGKKFNNLASGTIILFYNATDVDTAGSSQNPFLITRGNNTGGTNFDLVIDVSNGKMSCSLDATVTRALDTANFTKNAWNMLACTWNTTAVFNYRNGIFRASGAFTTGLPNDAQRTQLVIGGLIGSAGAGFKGSITEVMFFNRTLTDQEIQFIYNSSGLAVGVENSTLPSISAIAFDELTGASIYFNATFANSSSTFNTPNTNFFFNGTDSFPQGSNTITFRNASYYDSSQFLTITSNLTTTIAGYLMPIVNANGIFVRFTVIDISGLTISNAIVSIYKNGILLRQKTTDSAGVASFNLDFTTAYTIVVNSTTKGNVVIPTLIPVQNDYTIILGQSTVISFDYLFANITYYFFPDPRTLYTNASLVNFTIISYDNRLQWYGLLLEYNGTTIFNQSANQSGGGSISVIVNVSNRTGFVFAHPYFKKTLFAEFYDNTITLNIANYSQYQNATGIGKFVTGVRTAGLSGLTLGLVFLFLGLIGSSVIARTVGIGAGFVALIFVALVAFLGVFSADGSTPVTINVSGYELPNPAYWFWYAFIVLVVLSLIIIRAVGVGL